MTGVVVVVLHCCAFVISHLVRSGQDAASQKAKVKQEAYRKGYDVKGNLAKMKKRWTREQKGGHVQISDLLFRAVRNEGGEIVWWTRCRKVRQGVC